MDIQRLDKILSGSGSLSRSEARRYIKSGRITVNGNVEFDPESKHDRESAVVCIDGTQIISTQFRYFLLHKPTGIITATEDPKQETVLDLFPKELRRIGLFPVGRLDKDTSGLLIITNDGALAHQVISPKKHVSKVYYAEVDGMLSDEDKIALNEGIVLADGTRCLPAQLELLSAQAALVTVYEGKYHQVRRMLAARSCPVTKLKRLSIGGLTLPEELQPGSYIELERDEIERIFEQ